MKWLGWAYMAEKRWDDATTVTEKRLAMGPDKIWDDPIRHTTHSWMEEIALNQHDYTVAIKELKPLSIKGRGTRQKAQGRPKMLNKDIAQYLLDLGIGYD